MAVYTLFGQPASPATLTSDATAYTMGVQFSVNVSGSTLTGIWFYSGTGATNLPATIALYAVSGTSLVHSETPSWSGAAGSGWVRSSFASPPSLTASTNYKACVFYNPTGDNWYSHTANYWDTGAGSGGITNGPLSAPNNAGASGGQDTFTQAGSLSYPSSSFGASNYWVDPEVTTPAVVTFIRAGQPARSRLPLPSRGRMLSGAGAPARNPQSGTAFVPRGTPARIRPALPPRGRAASNPGGAVQNPMPPPPAHGPAYTASMSSM